MSGVGNLDEFVPLLEPIIRKWVKEEVSRAVDPYLRSLSTHQTESSRSRSLHLQFDCSLPPTLFTNNKIVSESTTPLKISLYDPTRQQIVTSGPHASMKVGVVVLQGDFLRDGGDHEWSQKEFESKIMLSREGKRPLLNGDMIVGLNNGVGYISNVSFTDNSSWDRSGRFRLGVRVHSGVDATSVREGISNAFKVKDQRGESYQKQHPPSLNDEVWRLEKIAKDGAYHKHLTKLGISSVGDFLRSYAINKNSLRAALCMISNKIWDAILAHAAECVVDEKKYVCRTNQGSVLLFDSIYTLIGVAFDGRTYQSLDTLEAYQREMVKDMKQHAFENFNSLRICEADTNILVPQHAHLHIEKGEVEMQINSHQKFETNDENRSLEIGESSEMQGFEFTFDNSFGMNDSPAGFYIVN